MADSIKIGNLDISAFKVGSGDCTVYLGNTLLYPTTFQGKWKANYQGGTVLSAQCVPDEDYIDYGEIALTNLISVEIGSCVIGIGSSAFNDYSSLSSVTIPDSVTSIYDDAFAYCPSLTSITIPNSVTYLGEGVFKSCTSLTSVNIPSGITSIRTDLFRDCSGLTSVTVNATTPPTLDSSAFSNTNNCPIYVPASAVETYKSATGWSDYASRIQAIPNS